ncbi:putative RING-H2 finger protein ATL21B [Prunus yedoensis var. nudiflora]|uniref:RING-type E3 ubiquitin transferase n=1 Tax=Prunus yedoensis var. nudiflora TaxID=2094558 RepID=A0A314ZGW6_PRUYE|nr:putative RING-H2 finger protein ATL21B [Prunus yedoensis var. nudiflora]
MATLEIFTFFFFFPLVVPSTTTCGPSICPAGGPLVRFPFLLRDHQASSCGHPGFNLSCNNKNQTILTLPSSSGDFIVENIDYKYQTLTINDPDNCLPRRFLHHDINLNNSPFLYAYATENYTFVGCSSQKASWPWNSASTIPCLTEEDHYKFIYVVQTSSLFQPDPILFPLGPKPLPAGCSKISTALVPFLFDFGAQLTWDSPNCRSCEAKGRVCGLENGTTTSQIRCFGSSGFSSLPRAATYGIVLGVGIPGLLCIIGLAGYVCNKTRVRGQIHQPTITQLLSTIPDRRPSTVRIGLDDPTIESYPEIQLGESWELPKLNDNTCPICLAEYQPKETLRTIPECSHYFHANCIDEWLRMSATCPVCRNPQKR